LRNGTLPRVWIAPAELRDQRELLRWRMYLASLRTGLKNRIHGTLLRYNLRSVTSDLFGAAGRQQLAELLEQLPPHTRGSVEKQLVTLDFIVLQIQGCEQALEAMLEDNVERDLLKTLPGVGRILSAVIALEIGDVKRFPDAAQLVSYAGLVPTLHESAKKRRMGQCPSDANQYLRWALVEAANIVVLNQKAWSGRHVVQLYQRVRANTKRHGKAVVAVARHLGEAAYWILSKQEVYRAPQPRVASSFVEARVNATCA
jgi:transposase